MEKVALITGASSGIERATAALLAKSGYRVFGAVRNTPSGEPIPNVDFLQLDVRHDESAKEAVRSLLSRAGRIDALVNNAGYTLIGSWMLMLASATAFLRPSEKIPQMVPFNDEYAGTPRDALTIRARLGSAVITRTTRRRTSSRRSAYRSGPRPGGLARPRRHAPASGDRGLAGHRDRGRDHRGSPCAHFRARAGAFPPGGCVHRGGGFPFRVSLRPGGCAGRIYRRGRAPARARYCQAAGTRRALPRET